jgi:hypothetical protein
MVFVNWLPGQGHFIFEFRKVQVHLRDAHFLMIADVTFPEGLPGIWVCFTWLRGLIRGHFPRRQRTCQAQHSLRNSLQLLSVVDLGGPRFAFVDFVTVAQMGVRAMDILVWTAFG